MEIEELGLQIWKDNMIEPLRSELVRLLLEGIEEDRKGKPNMNPDVIRVIIQSFVQVQCQQDRKNRGMEVYQVNIQTSF